MIPLVYIYILKLDSQLQQITEQNKNLLSQVRGKDLYIGKLTSDKLNIENVKMDLMREKELLLKQVQESKKNVDLSEILITDYKASFDINERYV